MTKLELEIGGRQCVVFAHERSPEWLLVQPTDTTDLRLMDSEVAIIERDTTARFTLVAVKIEKWNDALTPWPAPPVFGRRPFGGQAEGTLAYIESQLLPLYPDCRVALGGYSLAGLFSLWAAYRCPRLSAVVAASPSVWYPEWIGYAESHTALAPRIYLSQGDRESHSRTPILQQAGRCIERQHQLLQAQPGVATTLVWNQGNHFQDSDSRTAAGFVWAMN